MNNAGNLKKRLEKVRRDLLIYKTTVWPKKAGTLALAWIDASFQSQGYRDNTYVPWAGRKLRKQGNRPKHTGVLRDRSGRLLDTTGKLRASIKMRPMKEAVKIYTFCKYARVHNQGFRGTVHVRAHTRRLELSGHIAGTDGREYAFGANSSIKSRRRLKNKKVYNHQQVKAHSRKMNIPRRQFMPDNKRGSVMLRKDVRDMTQKDIQQILKTAR